MCTVLYECVSTNLYLIHTVSPLAEPLSPRRYVCILMLPFSSSVNVILPLIPRALKLTTARWAPIYNVWHFHRVMQNWITLSVIEGWGKTFAIQMFHPLPRYFWISYLVHPNIISLLSYLCYQWPQELSTELGKTSINWGALDHASHQLNTCDSCKTLIGGHEIHGRMHPN